MTTAIPQHSISPATPSPAAAVPRLENGDRLDRLEFERRYAVMPDYNKIQLVEGVVYMPSPVTHRHHSNPHFNTIGWLHHYAMVTPGIEGGDNGSLRLDMINEPQPDAYLIVLPSHGGQVQIDVDGYIVGAPELVVEVSATTVSLDVTSKLPAYRRNGVREYVVWRVKERGIDWYVLRDGLFQLLPLNTAGHYCSEVLPGLWLDPTALINGDLLKVSQVVGLGTATPEHAAFKESLQEAARRRAGS